MITLFKNIINRIFSTVGFQIIRIQDRALNPIGNSLEIVRSDAPILIKKNSYGSLYECIYGLKLYLNVDSYVERKILENNIWEKDSTIIIQKLVTSGNTVLDIGANFGYFSFILAKLVGKMGHVYASEPTSYFRIKFLKNLEENRFNSIELLPFGFSNTDSIKAIKIDASTASMHMPENDPFTKTESIKLTTLDKFVKDRGIRDLNFIKVDIDGHEPLFLKGAVNTIKKFKPDILLEINPLNYHLAGTAIWDFYDQIMDLGYFVYHEKGLEEITNKIDFLKRCGNFGWQGNWKAPFSLNVLLSKKSSKELLSL